MTASTMVTRVARAIDEGFDRGGLDGAARAAIAAMRDDVTPAMIAAANSAAMRIGTPASVWEAMIDAALEE